jgi:hypothetical protein
LRCRGQAQFSQREHRHRARRFVPRRHLLGPVRLAVSAGRGGNHRAADHSTVTDIKAALQDYKHRIRAGFKFYSQDLIKNLFIHPYTKIEFVERDLKVSRVTAAKSREALAGAGLVQKVKVGRSNYYVNVALNSILTRDSVFSTQ